MIRPLAYALACTALLAIPACVAVPVHSERGVKMSEGDLAFIKKGATSRAEVEKRFGPPTMTSLGSDGTRTASYLYSRTDRAIPLTDFIPTTSRTAIAHSSLQVTYSAQDVVADYQFSTSEKAYETNGSLWTGNLATKEVAPK